MMAISGPTMTKIAMDGYLIWKTSIPKASYMIAVAKLAMLKAAKLDLTKSRSRISVHDTSCTLRNRQLTGDALLHNHILASNVSGTHRLFARASVSK